MKVYIRDGVPRTRRFHRTKDCYQLLKYPARGSTRPLLEYETPDLPLAKPCKVCFPDYPSQNVVHRHCHICSPDGRVFPCAHNGGVQVVKTRIHTNSKSYVRPGPEEQTFRHWVWPDQVMLHM